MCYIFLATTRCCVNDADFKKDRIEKQSNTGKTRKKTTTTYCGRRFVFIQELTEKKLVSDDKRDGSFCHQTVSVAFVVVIVPRKEKGGACQTAYRGDDDKHLVYAEEAVFPLRDGADNRIVAHDAVSAIRSDLG